MLSLWDEIAVEAADPLDPKREHCAFDAGLHQPNKGECAEDEQPRQHCRHKRFQVPPRSLSKKSECDKPGEGVYELVTVVLTDLGDDRTEMVFHQRGRMTPDQYERAGEGWSSFFDRIAERLAEA
jgi:uncharacterized protein YndB with AHSA1/START domain